MVCLCVALCCATPALAQSDAQIRQMIVRDSVAAYLATGRPCACPYSTMRNGAACGSRSAYLRPGGRSPLCYETDVTAKAVAAYRRGRR